MIATPYPVCPRVGPLAAPSEEEVAAAYPELRAHALTLPWAAEVLGLQPAVLVGLARAGELLVVPGPWPMRQAHASGLGYLVPAWQLTDRLLVHEAVPALIAAATERGWTSLDLHRFATARLAEGGAVPTDLAQADEPVHAPVPVPRRRAGRRRRRTVRRGGRTASPL